MGWVASSCSRYTDACAPQAEYEVAPDEKRKECGQELIDAFFNPKVELQSHLKIFVSCSIAVGIKKTNFLGGFIAKWHQTHVMMYFSIFHHDRQTEIRSAPLVEIWCESCVSGLGYELCARQSEDHVVEVDESTVTRCEEGLQQEACKELFKDSTK